MPARAAGGADEDACGRRWGGRAPISARRATADSRAISSVAPSASISWRMSEGWFAMVAARTLRGSTGTANCNLLHPHDQSGAPIEPARLLARVVELRALLAVADRLQAVGAGAAAREIGADRIRPPPAERPGVLPRAHVARVTFHRVPQARVVLHPPPRSVHRPPA